MHNMMPALISSLLELSPFFTIGAVFPCDPLEHNYYDENSGVLLGRTELQRHTEYMRYVNEQLHACGQLRGDHPFIRMIQQCLHNLPAKRPGIREVLHLLEEARDGVRDDESERNKHELVYTSSSDPSQEPGECFTHFTRLSIVPCNLIEFGVCCSRSGDTECTKGQGAS